MCVLLISEFRYPLCIIVRDHSGVYVCVREVASFYAFSCTRILFAWTDEVMEVVLILCLGRS